MEEWPKITQQLMIKAQKSMLDHILHTLALALEKHTLQKGKNETQ